MPVMDKCGGQYAYFGTESWIVAAIAKISEFYCTNNTVKLIVNVECRVAVFTTFFWQYCSESFFRLK